MAETVNWSELIESWKQSGLSQRQFCEERGIVANQFSYWKRKLRGGLKRTPRFKRVPTLPQECCFELTSHSGVKIRVPMDFEPSSLERLLKALR